MQIPRKIATGVQTDEVVWHNGVQVDEIHEMARGRISFNFNKFRSMMIRVKTGLQLDADMIVGKYCDILFKATEKEVTPDYPYPIMPVHWMTRYREAGRKIDGYDVYALSYPDGWPSRIRWAHCHPTWTYHALPFIADTLMCKLDHEKWSSSPRVIAKLGASPARNPPMYMGEDEDILNILLWRYKALKQCVMKHIITSPPLHNGAKHVDLRWVFHPAPFHPAPLSAG